MVFFSKKPLCKTKHTDCMRMQVCVYTYMYACKVSHSRKHQKSSWLRESMLYSCMYRYVNTHDEYLEIHVQMLAKITYAHRYVCVCT